MGFNNYGAGAAANELRKRDAGPTAVPIGANIGKTKVTPLEGAADDPDADVRAAVRRSLRGSLASH